MVRCKYINIVLHKYVIELYKLYFCRTYPVYAVGEAGAMYTPASSQYYTPASTPVTYAQVIYESTNSIHNTCLEKNN